MNALLTIFRHTQAGCFPSYQEMPPFTSELNTIVISSNRESLSTAQDKAESVAPSLKGEK